MGREERGEPRKGERGWEERRGESPEEGRGERDGRTGDAERYLAAVNRCSVVDAMAPLE